MTGSVQNDVLQELQALSERFAERMTRELPELAAQARTLSTLGRPEQQAQLRHLQSQLHKLAGSSGSFGFAALGLDARILEQRAIALQTDPAPDLDSALTGDSSPLLTDFSAALAAFARQHQNLLRAPDSTPNQAAAARTDDSEPPTVHILDADLASARHLAQTLSNFGYTTCIHDTLSELELACQQNLTQALVVSTLGIARPAQLIADISALQARLPEALPLMVISEDSGFDSYLQAVRAGAMGFFAPPVNLSDMENRLERCFGMRHIEPYRVLIIDDDTDLTSHYRLVLQNAGFIIETEHEPLQALARLSRFRPEVLLLDVNMPDCSGPELAQIIRLKEEWLRLPIIYLSAETDMSRQMNALLKAGDDFLTKPISDNALVTSVFARAQRARLLSNALSCDSLTGLLQHKDIKEQMAIELSRAERNRQAVSIAMVDIDHFKHVNDSYGHPAGDNVIRTLANLLRQRIRKTDSLGRYGGEEFALVLVDCTAAQAKEILDDILLRFATLRFYAEGQDFGVTFSAGIAEYTAERAADGSSEYSVSTLLDEADKALYAAKRQGRNQVKI